ncbi:acylphosphatase [Thalassomonas sp. M1454]|uniref:acylphosphatase n=1 Tax=Thalassomonas sp. M1454 TaxID=2594477 RepID=UPI00117E627E|nr:acylphosphatase [Thalassomonas sp. M1454]TRX56788.1 acylphosphatase [Thalassomonas sp. M1454]
MKVCYIAKVTGTVQGVYFRASAQNQAIDLSLSGYAHNQDDGSVEVMVCGDNDNVQQMLKWLEQGPEEADVEAVEITPTNPKDINHFSIG